LVIASWICAGAKRNSRRRSKRKTNPPAENIIVKLYHKHAMGKGPLCERLAAGFCEKSRVSRGSGNGVLQIIDYLGPNTYLKN